jgi:hypothetical protein
MEIARKEWHASVVKRGEKDERKTRELDREKRRTRQAQDFI